VRSRHGDLLGDIGRTARQQELLLVLKQVLELASYARGLSSQDFTQMALGVPDYGYDAMIDSPEGNIWVEEPLWGAIYQTINQVFPESRGFKL